LTGCASRKPAAEIQAGNNPNSSGTVNTSGLSEDAALNAQNLAGASSKGVTAANELHLQNVLFTLIMTAVTYQMMTIKHFKHMHSF
jgi:hypothetical protein